MITYAKLKNGAVDIYPYGLSKLREENPNVSFPNSALKNEDIRQEFNIVEVKPVEMPNRPGWKAVQIGPVESNGEWSQKWEEVPKTAEELNAQDITNLEPPSDLGLNDEHGVQIKFAVDNGPVWKDDHWEIDWQTEEYPYRVKRLNAYGALNLQIEHIVERGLDSWKAHVEEIKARYPKT